MRIEPKLTDFGLDDKRLLREATQLVPELFAALLVAANTEETRFPITTVACIEQLLGDEGVLQFDGVFVTQNDVQKGFPKEFLPIVDRCDLARKAYIAIVSDHHERGRRARKQYIEEGSFPKGGDRFAVLFSDKEAL